MNIYSIGLNGIITDLDRFNAAAYEINRGADDTLDAQIDMLIAGHAISANLETLKTAAGIHRFLIDIFA